MIILVLKTISVVIAGLMVGNELAVSAFVHPRLAALDDKTHAASAQALARVYGAVMPIWYAVVLILTGMIALVIQPSTATEIAATSAVVWASSIIFTLLFPVPINNQIIRWDLDSLPDNWKELRRKWDRLHAIRIFMLLFALTCLTVACLIAK